MVYKTPMLQQYQAIKEQYPDCLLFFRLGDFYELFGDDAKIGSEVLHITLTARDKGGDGKIPMCGVPFHASENYIARLVNAGYKVAICEQLTPPGRGLVEREVIRVVTAGTLLRDESLTEAGSQYVLSLLVEPKVVGGAAADLSTGQFLAFSFPGGPEEIIPLIMSHFKPREVVIPKTLYDDPRLVNLIRQEESVNITCAHDWLVYSQEAAKLLVSHFQVASLDSFGLRDKPTAIKAAAALLGYLRYTQKGNIAHITAIREFHFTGHLILDQRALRHLEIVRTAEGTVEGSLFATLNETVTAAGERLLQDWLLKPITNIGALTARHEAVGELMSRPALIKAAREAMASLSDSERLVGRLAVGVGTPRDLRRLADTLWHWQSIVLPHFAGVKAKRLGQLTRPPTPALGKWVGAARAKLFEEAKPTLDEGYIFKAGVDRSLDQLRELTRDNKSWLAEFEAQERARTGIPKLRVVYSRAFGYAIEVTKPFKDRVPQDYVPRQTLVAAERYTTTPLAEYEQRALTALEEMVELEKTLFAQEVRAVVALSSTIAAVAHQIAELDVSVNFALLAKTRNYVRPTPVETVGIKIKDGRHPVIERVTDEPFVANDTELSPDKSLQLITGPNMAGKSTYIRQVALIVLMAHTGSFVPARSATIGLTDRLFTRIGTQDNLRAGQSTFMVEMLETAHILHNATSRSLIILDEVGRGTSPEDGFALAWAVTEALTQPGRGFVLFATHFHDLKGVTETHPSVFNSHLAVAVDEDDLIFLRKVTPGATEESYGLVVAEKAGIPKTIIRRAKQVALGPIQARAKVNSAQIALLAPGEPGGELAEKVRGLALDSLTPLAALAFLAELQGEIKKNPRPIGP